MKKKLLSLMLAMLSSMAAWSADGDKFTANTSEGVPMQFVITSETSKTCRVGRNAISSTYSGKVTIPSKANGYTVSSIGSYAFYTLSNITSVTIPNTVESIEEGAFSNNTGIVSISIPNSVVSIEKMAFMNCTNLKSIVLSNNLRTIGQQVFMKCENLTSISLPQGITSIGLSAFNGCSNLANVVMPIKMKEIGKSVFKDCKKLVISNLPDSISSIGESAFENCSSITSLIVPGNSTTIGSKAFHGCYNMASLTLSEGVDSIGDRAFGNCRSIETLQIPSTVRFIGELAFSDGRNINSISVAKDNPIYDSRDACNAIILKSQNKIVVGCQNTIIPKSIHTIGEYAFYGCYYLKSIVIPEGSVYTIERWAFADTGLESITLPKCTGSINDYAFYNCNLKKVVVVSSFVTFTDKVFYDNHISVFFSGSKTPPTFSTDIFNYLSPKDTLYVPKGSLSAYKNASPWKGFKTIIEIAPVIAFDDFAVKDICVNKWDSDNNGEITEDEITTVTSIGTTFNGNKDIRTFNELKYFTGLTTISAYAFYTCSNLKSVEFPTSIRTIGKWAFAGVAIEDLQIPNYVTGIDNSAFRNCINMSSAMIENGVTSIGKNAFRGCTKLSIVHLLGNTTNYGEDVFRDCDALETVNIYGLNEWCNSTFYNADANPLTKARRLSQYGNSQTTIYIPEGVTSIKSFAFYNCNSMQSLVIPESVTSIASTAFIGCDNLVSVVTKSKTPISDASTFTNRGKMVLHVPLGCKPAYQTGNYWKEFALIVDPSSCAVSIGSNNIATYCNTQGLKFGDNGVKAYIATGFNQETGELALTRIFDVPKQEGILLKGETGYYEVPYEETDRVYSNLLKGLTTATTVSPTDGDYTNFILGNGEKYGIGFYTLSQAGEMAAGKAYLQLPTSALPVAEGRYIKLVFDDDESMTTGIENVNSQSRKDQYVDLQGRHVSKPVKGLLYIVNGKKYLAK